MPDWLTSILLGVIEGITEFLPVSSTGHLLLPQQLGWLEKQTDLFNIAIQSGAVIAVLFNFTDRVIFDVFDAPVGPAMMDQARMTSADSLGGFSRRLFTAVAAECLHRFERLGEIPVGAEARARA